MNIRTELEKIISPNGAGLAKIEAIEALFKAVLKRSRRISRQKIKSKRG